MNTVSVAYPQGLYKESQPPPTRSNVRARGQRVEHLPHNERWEKFQDSQNSCQRIVITFSSLTCLLILCFKEPFYFLKILFIYFRERGGEGERERERESNISVWLPLTHPLLGTWPATQACALTGN